MRFWRGYVLSGLGLLLPSTGWAAPPPLPTEDAAPAEPGPADPAAPAPAAEPPATEAPAMEPADDLGADPGAEMLSPESDDDAPPLLGEDDEGDEGDEDDGARGDDSDPGMVRGRREPMMPANRGSIGLFHTSLPDAGGRNTFRFRLHTDFFRREAFIFEGAQGPDNHSRVRGGVTLGFSPLEYLELFFSVNSQANRNERIQTNRQDAETVFALGDIDFGVKGAYRLTKYGLGFGGQVGIGLLSGSSRLVTEGVNFWVDGLFAVDVRYLTKNQFPFRFTTNIGFMLDNSLSIAEFGQIRDSTSREVLRFALGANHNRMRFRNGIDFPIRLGKERQFGIDPIVEWSWDVSLQEEALAFSQQNATDSPLPRSTQWVTVGLRGNVVSGLHVDAGVDIGAVSPNFEFGPPQPPWQVMLGLGWSFDPNPVIKEVEVEGDVAPPPPPPAVVDGRILGQVVDPSGAPVPGAIVSFPGLTSTSVLTDESGSFTSFRFPAGQVNVQVSQDGAVVAQATAEVSEGEDTSLQIQLETEAAPATGVMQAAFVDAAGTPVVGSMQVVGQGVDQAFDSTPEGYVALELYEGEYQATISAPGYKTVSTSFVVTAGQEVPVNVTLEPDKAPETPNVSGSKNSIRLKQKIRYSGNDVSPKSHAILDELATFLQYHPEFELVEVGVHTDDRGPAKKRTDARAEAVKSYLVSKGIASSRLSTKGFGASKPVAVNMTAAGRAKNNRTILKVKQYSGG